MIIIRDKKLSNKLYRNIVEAYKLEFAASTRARRSMILEASRSWYGKELGDDEDQSRMDKVSGIRVQFSRLKNKYNQLTSGDRKLSPEQYAQIVASMIKEMDQLITRWRQDKIELAAGKLMNINIIPHYGNTPDWLEDAIDNGKTSQELINKALKKLNYGLSVKNDNHKQNYRKNQKERFKTSSGKSNN